MMKEESFNNLISWCRLGVYDIESRYRRTMIGPLWLVVSTGLSIACLGFLYGTLFSLDLREFFPYVAAGIIIWTLVSFLVIEGANSFIAYRFIILNIYTYPVSIILRVLVRNLIVFAHNLFIFVLVAWFCGITPTGSLIWMIPGMGLLVINAFWVMIVLAYASARYRDVPQTISTVIGLLFLFTPVIWQPDLLENRRYLAELNPFTHVLALVREPMLGATPSPTSWIVVGSLAFFGILIAGTVHIYCKDRLPFWL